MGKFDREFTARMQGLLYAQKIVKESGLEELEKEIKRRGINRLPLGVSKAEADGVWYELCQNMYNNITVTFLYCLKEYFGFTKEQFEELIEKYQQTVGDVMDMDYMGEHYVNMTDYAIEVKKELGIDIDINRIAACQDHYDATNKDSHYHMAKIERIIEVLEDNNYLAASTFLKHKIDTI